MHLPNCFLLLALRSTFYSAVTPGCFRCSAEKVGCAFKGEHDDAEGRYVIDSYHIEHAGSAVTARVTYQQGNYGTKFVGVSMDRSCCAPKATVQGADKARICQSPATPNLDVFTFLPRVDIDSCALVSKRWRATIERRRKSLTLHPLAQFTIYENGSSRCAYKLADERLQFRASASAMLDAMRNSHIEHLHVENTHHSFFVELTEFTEDSNVTSLETTLMLPTFLSTNGTRAAQASTQLIGKLTKHLRSEVLAVNFDAEQRDFRVIGQEHFRHRLRDLKIVITNEHLPSFELGRLIFSKRSANVHLTLSTPPSAHFLSAFLDDLLQQCTYECLHQMTILKFAVKHETVYDAPTWLKFIKGFALGDDALRQQFACYFLLRATDCRVYELRSRNGDIYTVIISREPESRATSGNRALQVVIVPAKITFASM